MLSEPDSNTVFQLEGVEDIDKIKLMPLSAETVHIQLKQSTAKQDASFLKDVLKNFLEAYLLAKNHKFKLVYDFKVATGNLIKLFDNTLDTKATLYWKNIVQDIKFENPHWDWTDFLFEDFVANLSFEKKERTYLEEEIEKALINSYGITLDNISLYANGIKIMCLEKMETRGQISMQELSNVVENIKNDISKGVQNPAHSWIKRVTFGDSSINEDLSYYEGKKPTSTDIFRKLPVRRPGLEQELKESISKNKATIVKASSGQGKTTVALQVSYNLQHEYTIYQLLWCDDQKELGNIVQYFKSRIKVGEKPLILIDNLNAQLKEWNKLAQLLQEEIGNHYKLLLNTREDDWYNFGGNLADIKSLHVIKLVLQEAEAQSIFVTLGDAKKLHPSIEDWRNAWSKVADRGLLIEYVYLLTHGEMLSERIAHQINQISKSDAGRVTCEMLRKVCFADLCGIMLPVKKLIASVSDTTVRDYGEILKSIENEFLIRIDDEEKYVEGVHPVRSQHIVDCLHQFIGIEETAQQVVQITDLKYLSQLFSRLPQFVCKR